MSLNNQEAKTREELKKAKKEQAEGEVRPKHKRIRIRLIPIWLRLIIILALLFVSASAGAMVGYSVLGEGKPTDVFNKSTWTHVVDLVNKQK